MSSQTLEQPKLAHVLRIYAANLALMACTAAWVGSMFFELARSSFIWITIVVCALQIGFTLAILLASRKDKPHSPERAATVTCILAVWSFYIALSFWQALPMVSQEFGLPSTVVVSAVGLLFLAYRKMRIRSKRRTQE
jgi:hypothetical protein